MFGSANGFFFFNARGTSRTFSCAHGCKHSCDRWNAEISRWPSLAHGFTSLFRLLFLLRSLRAVRMGSDDMETQ